MQDDETPQNNAAWRLGSVHGHDGIPSCPYPPCSDLTLAYWSGFTQASQSSSLGAGAPTRRAIRQRRSFHLKDESGAFLIERQRDKRRRSSLR